MEPNCLGDMLFRFVFILDINEPTLLFEGVLSMMFDSLLTNFFIFDSKLPLLPEIGVFIPEILSFL